ncbi:GAF and ANTAR domain-containing protein [Streptomyces sp. NPDC102487]|uniref:GAF and ANTAR domain-containing protein n=1 Tax=Streptomyces sp. NPDC102487 TaxID=3366182 RepID=UPI0038275DF2
MKQVGSDHADQPHDGPGSPDEADFSPNGMVKALLSTAAEVDKSDVPARLCQACVDLLDITGASISLSGEGDTRATWWSSDPVAAKLAEAQYSLGDGPCRSAMQEMAPVLAADLSEGQDARRWPLFAYQAVELGVRAVFSLPLGSSVVAMGSLDLYRSTPGPLSERDQSFAFPAADAITTALLSLHLASTSAGEDWAWFETAETDHSDVHRATGMIMIFLGLDAPQALARLRAHAFTSGQSVTEAARDVIAGRISFHD